MEKAMAFERWRGFVRAWQDYPLREGAWIGKRYQVESLLGEGSYGLTYRCFDAKEETLVAVKQSRPSKKAAGRALLGKESNILRALNHSNIPVCRDYFEYKDLNWLVSDYIEGKTLEDKIFAEHMVYGERECLDTTLKLMELVSYVHSRGFVHLDLRIPNVILRDAELYLIDFGLARQIGEIESTDAGHEPKSEEMPVRMPPVIVSDLYYVGQLMLFMLYSAYQPEPGGAERSWREELDLSHEMLHILTRLHGEQEAYEDTASFVREAEQFYRSLQ